MPNKTANKFRIINIGFDELCGGEERFDADLAVMMIRSHHGWDSLSELRQRIREWCAKASPGEIFKTKGSVIICCK